MYQGIVRETRDHPMDDTSHLLLKADEVAERLRFGRATVYRMMASGILPVVRHGRAVRVPLKGLLEWVEQKTEQRELR